MRNANPLLILVASLLLWGCGTPEEPLSPSFAEGGCAVTWTFIGTKGLIVAPNSNDNSAGWVLRNTGTVAITLTGDAVTGAGAAIRAVRRTFWSSFPSNLSVGSQRNARMLFDANASGTGAVNMTVSSSCGSLAAPFHTVTVQPSPTVTTNPAGGIGPTSATLHGTANPNGAATTGWFRYATTNPPSCNDTFGTRAPAAGGTALGSGDAAVAYSRAITGLTNNTTYYFCAIASNSSGIGLGTVRSFVASGLP